MTKRSKRTRSSRKNKPPDLGAIVRIYIREIRPRAREELDWFRSQPSLRDAVELAGLAKNRCGNRYSHQRRLKQSALDEARRTLLCHLEEIKKAESFDDLHSLIEKWVDPIPGIGELYIYDTSLRIGAKLGKLPEKVYLHAGVRRGARSLLGVGGRSGEFVDPSNLPPELRDHLAPHEIEDVLCIFKDELKIAAEMLSRETMLRRSWCG